MLRVGIVGLGRWGRRLVDSVQGRGVEPSTVMRFTKAHTRTPAGAAEYMAGVGLQEVPTYEALLNDPAIDAVVLATPHRSPVKRPASSSRWATTDASYLPTRT